MSTELLDALVEQPEESGAAPEEAVAVAEEGGAPATAEPVKEPAETVSLTETAPAAAPTPTPAKEPERTVPLAALLEERRQSEARLRALEERLAKTEPAKPVPEPDPDYVQDPKGYVDAKTERALKALEELKKQGTDSIEQTRAQVAEIQLAGAIQAAEAQVAGEIPDYQQALAHVRNVRFQQLQLVNPGATQEQLVAHLSQEERAMAAAELGAGRNPYTLLYQVAKTFGYKAAEKLATTTTTAPAKPNGTLPPDLTLGKTGGASPDTSAPEADDEGDDILAAAFSERFGRKRA